MTLLSHISLFLAVFTISEARVTFRHSEVLQLADLVKYAAPFNCARGCKVYVNRGDESLYISQNGIFIATFTEIVGRNLFEPAGIILKAGKNYKLQSHGTPSADFVFYVVSNDAPNFGSPVFVPQVKLGIADNWHARYFTILSSFNAIEVYGFYGTYPTGYPRIYSTGFDAVGDSQCTPVFQARSQYNAEQSRALIFSPILTVDYGYVGKHSASANKDDGKKPPVKTAASSTVYMSPGYVGCSYVGNQMYHSNVNSVKDSFTQDANSLDITAVYNAISPDEPVQFRVNQDTLDFLYLNSSSFNKHYGKGRFDVDLSWTRETAGSSWALQLDFGIVPEPVATTSASNPSSSPTNRATSTATVSYDLSTTSGCDRDVDIVLSLIPIFAFLISNKFMF